ncbi:cAMP-dependent protein kinase catalytic subunit-like [Zophobas morio]|uniref:cAMP-dependent protein kinase catalytic subunit-like n=1 Tax=Zophobas morio TaxID=2755281 RepID=UPI0030836DD0
MIEHFHLSWPKTCFAYKFLRKGSIEFNHFNVVKLIGLGAFGKVYLCEHKLTDSSMLYIITEFVSGGELAYQLEVAPHQKFSEGRARFYVAELLVAIEYLHTKEQIVYRDIKLENIVLDKKGHIKLIDYGFSKKLFKGEKTYTCCGTTEYLAPEVIMGVGYSFEADVWSIGVLLYKMVVGRAPFFTSDLRCRKAQFKVILSGKFNLPYYLSAALKDLICSLLQVQRRYRLGSINGLVDIKKHEWFSGIDWGAIKKKTVKPPKPYSYENLNLNNPYWHSNSVAEEVKHSVFSDFDFNPENLVAAEKALS